MPGMIEVSQETVKKFTKQIEGYADGGEEAYSAEMSRLGKELAKENPLLSSLINNAVMFSAAKYGPQSGIETFDNMVAIYFLIRNEMLKQQSGLN